MLHIIYRSTGRSNQKNRPPWFNKALCLASLIRSTRAAGDGVDITYVNDGPIPEARLALMNATGTVQTRSGMGNAGSQRYCFQLATRSSWSDDDIVYFCEDDYLHREPAVPATVGHVTGDHWFTLYDHPDEYERGPVSAPVNGWRVASSTCFTFGGPLRLIRATRLESFVVTIPNTPRDHLFWQLVQRSGPFRLLPRTERLRPLVVAVPALATHAEPSFLSPGVDWASEAGAVLAWAEEHGIDARESTG